MRWLRAISAIVLAYACTVASAVEAPQNLAGLMGAVAASDWPAATRIATALDRAAGSGDFYKAFVSASELVENGQCSTARPLIAIMRMSQPYFLPTYQLAFRCDSAGGDKAAALADLDGLLAALPPGPQRDLVAQTRSNLAGEGRPTISVYADIVPSSNADRQTADTTIGGWTINDESRGHPGILADAGAVVSKTFLTSERLSFSGALRAELAYSTVDNLLSPTLISELPVSFKLPLDIQVVLTPYASTTFDGFAFDNAAVGARVVGNRDLNSAVSLSWANRLSYTHFQQMPERTGLQYASEATLAGITDPNTRVTGAIGIDGETTADPDLQTMDLHVSLRADHVLDGGLVIGAEIGVGRRFHNQPPPLSAGPNQTDTYYDVRLELSHRAITIGAFMPTLYYQYMSQQSDSPFYTFQSHDVGISLKAKL